MVSDFHPTQLVFSVNFPVTPFPEIILTESPSNPKINTILIKGLFLDFTKWQRVMRLTYDSYILFTVELRCVQCAELSFFDK